MLIEILSDKLLNLLVVITSKFKPFYIIRIEGIAVSDTGRGI